MSTVRIPSTQSRSTPVSRAAVFRPTQQRDSSSTPRKRTLPACVCTKQPSRNRRHCRCQRIHSARRLPAALPCMPNRTNLLPHATHYRATSTAVKSSHSGLCAITAHRLALGHQCVISKIREVKKRSNNT